MYASPRGAPHQRADDLVRVAERQPPGDQIVGDVGRQQQTRGGACGHGRVRRESANDRGGGAQTRNPGVFGVEQRFLVLLQILVVAAASPFIDTSQPVR